MYEHHECTPSLTNEEQRSAAKLIKRISPEKSVFQLPSGGTVTQCRKRVISRFQVFDILEV